MVIGTIETSDLLGRFFACMEFMEFSAFFNNQIVQRCVNVACIDLSG
eukprot:COSAG05_NODE_1235_length_5438_cov_19.332272_4_plen_47_part_00